MVKRKYCYPAGCAILGVMKALTTDMSTILSIKDGLMKKETEYLQICLEKLPVDNLLLVMSGSINHRYYGLKKVDIDEDNFTMMASAGVAALREFAPKSKLLKSHALLRVSGKNEITGAVINIAMKSVAENRSLGRNLFAIEAPKEERKGDDAGK
jgi:hypothetical protein